ncbi:sulfatase [Planctomycetota bacterium]
MRRVVSRPSFWKQAGLGVAGLCLLLAGCEPTTLISGGKKPNFVILITDDQRADALGVINPIIQTPHMDSLAQTGVQFSNAYVTTSICCSSRASIFTGQHTARHNVYNFRTLLSAEAMSRTYHDQLRQAGYRTAFVGKYGLGQQKPPPADHFDYWQGFMNQGRYENTDEKGRYKHITRIIGDQALDFLDSCDGKKPFCLSVSFKAPHVQDGDPRQFIYDPAYQHLYQDVTFSPPATGDDRYWEQFPEFFRENNEARKRWQKRFVTPELYQKMVKGYYRLVYGVDVQIGRLRQKLAEKGMADNTVIILMGDNGFFLGEHGMAGKWFAQEESIRVPLLVYDPRLPASQRGIRNKDIALNIDIAPTVLALADVPPPIGMQGSSLAPLLGGHKVVWRQDFYYEHLFDAVTIPKCEAVVSTRWKYIRYPDTDPMYEQLFDLKNDPNETKNLVGIPKYQEQLQRMQLRFDELKTLAQ